MGTQRKRIGERDVMVSASCYFCKENRGLENYNGVCFCVPSFLTEGLIWKEKKSYLFWKLKKGTGVSKKGW